MSSKPGRYGIERLVSLAPLRPAYWKTLAMLRPDHTSVSIEDGALRFADYRFEPASVFPAGSVDADRIEEINLRYPSEVRLASGEILFVPPPGKDALLTFANQHDVRVERRGSVWSALLNPFLDTWEDQEQIDRELASLATLGLDREAVDAWRREVAVPMTAYNFGTRLWEWVNLTLYDALLAERAHLGRAEFADFYARAQRVAALDPRLDAPASPEPTGIDDALFAVLLEWVPRGKPRKPKGFVRELAERHDRVKALQQKLLAELRAAYSEAGRCYHTLAHVEHCLGELDAHFNYAVKLAEIRWALLFHDAVYDTHRSDNEARSADWACRVMDELGRPDAEKARVRALIMATAHASEPRTADEALLLDIDLSILGAGPGVFDEYDRSIRAEYAWVPEEQFRRSRAQILETFLRRERIFRTAPYRQRCEKPARANLERALARLE